MTSPVVDDDRVYVIPYDKFQDDVWEMRCPIICLRTDGTELWRADQTFWATEASTPLIVGDTLYVAADNPQRAVLVALDKRTGALKWSTAAESDKPRELGAPASLTYQEVDGVPQVIVATYGTCEVLGVHAQTGEIMWRYPYPADIIIGLVSTPVAVGNSLFICGGEGKGRDFSTCLQMSVVDGKISYRELYRSTELQNNMFNTVAVYQDAVFGFGGTRTFGFIHCTNLEDGRLLWKQEHREWTKDQNLVVADGLIFALTKNDEMVLAEASREGYRELGRSRREHGTRYAPTTHDCQRPVVSARQEHGRVLSGRSGVNWDGSRLHFGPPRFLVRPSAVGHAPASGACDRIKRERVLARLERKRHGASHALRLEDCRNHGHGEAPFVDTGLRLPVFLDRLHQVDAGCHVARRQAAVLQGLGLSQARRN